MDLSFLCARLLSYPIEITVDGKETQVEIAVEKSILARARNTEEFFIGKGTMWRKQSFSLFFFTFMHDILPCSSFGG